MNPRLEAISDFQAKSARIAEGVRLEIEQFREFGGPTLYDLAMISTFADVFAFGKRSEVAVLPAEELSKKDRGHKAKLEAMEIRAIAVMAFLPGGIHIYGQHFEAAGGFSGNDQS